MCPKVKNPHKLTTSSATKMSPRTAPTVLGALLLLAFIYLNILSPARSPFPLRLPFPWLQPRMSFAGRNATSFIDLADNSTFYINGWNSYWLMSSVSPPLISSMLRRGRAMGLTVCRTWAFSDRLQTSPARFDDRLFQSLDYVVYEARRNGVRLILSLVNNLSAFGGKERYVRWAMAAGVNVTVESDAFFEDETVKGYYKDYVKAILTRRNSFSGIRYMDEPAIFAWELMNEPRCVFNSSAPLLQAWIVEMALYVKSLDNKHLVTVGLEGFYGARRPESLGINPGDWASSVGSDFIQNSADEHIDFASVHAYPDTWLPKASLEEKVKYLSSWVESHVNDSEYILKKPVIFSEVGFNLHVEEHGLYERDISLKIVYDKIYDSAKRRQAGAGALIWQLMIEEMEGYHDEFSLVASEYPSTYKLIEQQSCRLHKLFMRKGEENQKISHLC